MKKLGRRDALAGAAGAFGAFGAFGLSAVPRTLAAARSAGLPGRVRMSCNLFTFNRLLASGEMSLEQVLELCARLGFDAVDPTGYYFPGYPAAPPDDFVYRIRRRAFEWGLDISGTGVRNDFTVADDAKRTADIALVGAWVDVASKLGAPNLRVFSGKGRPPADERPAVLGRLVTSLQQCARLGAGRGVMIALQNHNDFLVTADETLEALRAAASEWLGLNLDIGSLPGPDPYGEIERLAPHAITWQVKENVLISGKCSRGGVCETCG
jgi:sugar phosphate isomerase/epimerase